MSIKINVLLISSLILFFSALSYSQSTSKRFMDYTYSWDGKSSLLHVKLNYTPVIKDSTVFSYGEKNKQFNIFKSLKNIKVRGGDRVKINTDEITITVYHKNKGIKEIVFDIDGNEKKNENVDERFKPIIKEDFLYSIGKYLVLKSNSQDSIIHSVRWLNLPKRSNPFLSYKIEYNPYIKYSLNPDVLKESMIFVSSTYEIQQESVNNIPYYYLYPKGDTTNNFRKYSKEICMPYFYRLREFWGDYSDPYYFVFFIKSDYAGGIGIHNGCIVKYLPEKESIFKEKKVFCHEAVHHWIGSKMEIIDTKVGVDHQWFGEGFTEYTAYFTMAGSGILTNKQFESGINEDKFKFHYSNPVKNLPNDSISINFWIGNNYTELPYKRGFIYAFYLDNQIRLASNGKRTLRDFMEALFEKAKENRKNGGRLSVTDFLSIGEKYLPKEKFKEDFETYIIKGNPIDFRKEKLLDAFDVKYEGEIPVLTIRKDVAIQSVYAW